jgi:hypothetical protein
VEAKFKFIDMLKSFIKVTLTGILLAIVSVGFAQSGSKWKVEYQTDDFGDKNGKCRIFQIAFDDIGIECEIIVAKLDKVGTTFGISLDFKDEITNRDAYLSIKSEGNKAIESQKGYYFADSKLAVFEMTSEMISLFKNSSNLKIALRLSGYNPSVIEIDCIGFTKAFNEMLECKKM